MLDKKTIQLRAICSQYLQYPNAMLSFVLIRLFARVYACALSLSLSKHAMLDYPWMLLDIIEGKTLIRIEDEELDTLATGWSMRPKLTFLIRSRASGLTKAGTE